VQSSLLQVEVSEIVAHEADDPNSVVDFFDADALAGEHGRDVNLLAIQADAAAGGDQELPIVEWIVTLLRSSATTGSNSAIEIRKCLGTARLVSERPPGEVETWWESEESVGLRRAKGTTRKNNR
jgi:hypothetical protein